MSVIFNWDPKNFDSMVEGCKSNTVTPFVFEYMPKHDYILEAGCGLGNFVKFLQDKNYNVKGIELNAEAVEAINKMHPELDIIYGDVTNLPYQNDFFSGVLSFGVVEHSPEGPEKALDEMYRVMKPGAKAVVVVPCFNKLRKIKYYTGLIFLEYFLRRVYYRLMGKKVEWLYKNNTPRLKKYRFHRWPVIGNFFEYRFLPEEFDGLLLKAGFNIERREPIDFFGGLYHEFGSWLVKGFTEKTINFPTKILHKVFSGISYFHNHMYLCIVSKPKQN